MRLVIPQRLHDADDLVDHVNADERLDLNHGSPSPAASPRASRPSTMRQIDGSRKRRQERGGDETTDHHRGEGTLHLGAHASGQQEREEAEAREEEHQGRGEHERPLPERGAVEKHVGLLTVTDGGTLFLDEAGDLSVEGVGDAPAVSPARRGETVGSTRTFRVDVRLIAATHRDLEAAVERGAFREDLYYRLRRVVLDVPPLRNRSEGIPLLDEHFLDEISRRYGLTIRGVTPEALAALHACAWPGNVRELEAVLEQAMLFQRGGGITPGDPDVLSRGRAGVSPISREVDGPPATPTLSWFQQEALRIVGASVARFDAVMLSLVASCPVKSRAENSQGWFDVDSSRRLGFGRGSRYVLPVASARPDERVSG